jgi:hypothetical protein
VGWAPATSAQTQSITRFRRCKVESTNMLAAEISIPGVIIALGTSVTVSLPGIWRSLVMCKSDERLQMVGALLSAHGFSCRELIQEQIAFPMLFRLHMRI